MVEEKESGKERDSSEVFKIVTLILIVLFGIFLVNRSGAFKFDWLKDLREFSRKSPFIFIILFFLTGLIRPLFPIPYSAVLISSGLVSGIFTGFIGGMLHSLSGAVPTFYLGRYLGSPFVRDRFLRSEKARKFVEKSHIDTFSGVLALRLTPFIPFDITSYLCGAFMTPFRPYMEATIISSILWGVSFTFLGDSLVKGGIYPYVGVLFVGFIASLIFLKNYFSLNIFLKT